MGKKVSRSGRGDQENLRVQEELLRKQQRMEKGSETQREPSRRGSGLEEDCKMEVEEENDCNKKLDEQRKRLQRQLRDIEKFTDMEPMFRDIQKEKWEDQLQEIERKRTEAPEDAEEVSEVAEFAAQEEDFLCIQVLQAGEERRGSCASQWMLL